jgi:hypothetical protein
MSTKIPKRSGINQGEAIPGSDILQKYAEKALINTLLRNLKNRLDNDSRG